MDGSPEFKNGLRVRVLFPHAVHQSRKIILPFVRKHPPLQHQEYLRGFLVLTGCDIAVRELEELGHAFIFFSQELIEQLARAFEISRSHERVAVRGEKRRVVFGSGKGLQQRRGAHGIPGLQVCLSVEQSHAAFLRRQFVRAPKKMKRVGRGAARRS